MNGFRWLSLIVAVALLLTGPLALGAWAQEPRQPDVFQEALKASEQQVKEPGAKELGPEVYGVAAGIATAVNVPGRAITCVLGTAVGFGVLLITFGTGYRAATRVVEDGCQGPWILTAEDLRGRPTSEAESMSRY